jgi:hypothetical protein
MSTTCSNAECAAEAVFIVEFGLVGMPARSRIFLCPRCFNQLTENMAIEVVATKSFAPGS